MRIKAPFPADLAAASGHGCPTLYLRKNVADWPMRKTPCKLINA
jgi:hypothetical protein